MRLFLKIISSILILSIVFSFFVFPFSAYADSADSWSTVSSIYDYLADYEGETFFDQYSDESFVSCSGCSASSSGYHNWYFLNTGGGLDMIAGYYYCTYCGITYSDYCSSAYAAGVAEMPFDTVDNEGGIYWYPTWNDCTFARFAVSGSSNQSWSYYYIVDSSGVFTGSYVRGTAIVITAGSRTLSILYDSSSNCSSGFGSFSVSFSAPYSGTYKRLASTGYSGTRVATGASISSSFSTEWSSLSSYYSAGTEFSVSTSSYPIGASFYVNGTLTLPVYQFIPASSTVNNYYVNASRPTYNITYNLATVTQAGDYTVINNVYENQTIINEGDNIFIDPDTGDEYEIEGWEFDYTTRTYKCTLTDGSLLEVTLGDAYVTVNLNGELEYYYYATPDEDGGGVSGGDSDCTHDFALAEALEPTCTTGGYEVYVCKLCAATYKDTSFAIGHNYELVETVDPSVSLDESTLVCPGCNATEDLSYELTGDETFTVTCGSCSESWTVAGSVTAGYDLYRCSNCGDEYKDYTGEGVIRDDAGYWSWLQTWLQNFKTWLGEKLDALASGFSSSGSGTGDLDVEVNMGDDVDYNITYTDEETGEETNITIKDFIGKFAFIKDIWKIGQTLIAVVSEDAAYAYEFDPTIGNEATTDTGEEVAAASITEEADTLLSSGSGAPSIPINLGAANSAYGWNYGGEVEMLDLSWYTPYKEAVDNLVGGFLWLFFMWKLFQKAPGILSGASMDSSKAEDIKSGTKGKKR